MAAPRYLSRAPITEALIDFRIPLTQPLEGKWLSELGEELGDRYPQVEDIRLFEATIDAKGGQLVPGPPEDRKLGWMFRTPAGEQVAQFRRDGFTFNRLKPYTQWEDLFPQAIALWRTYVRVFRPTQIARLGVRFINRLPFVAPPGTLGLTAPPRVPEGLSLQIHGFLDRLHLTGDDGASAILTRTAESPLLSDRPVVLLDVDAFSDVTFEPDESGIVPAFEALRQLKNRVFFASITDETAGLYE